MKLFGEVAVGRDAAERVESANHPPRVIELVTQEARAGAGRVKVMVVVPFTGDEPRPELIDRQILAVEVDPVLPLVFPAAMTVVVERSNADGPHAARSEDRHGERMAAEKVERAVPESPVEGEMNDGTQRMGDRAPAEVLCVGVRLDPRVLDHRHGGAVLRFRHRARDRLMDRVGEKAIKPAAMHVVRVSGLFGDGVVDVVRHDVELFGDDLHHGVSNEEAPEGVREAVGAVRRVAVVPDGAVGSQDHHAVDEGDGEVPPRQKVGEKQRERHRENGDGEPGKEGHPVAPIADDVQPREKLAEEHASRRNDELPITCPPVGGRF